MIPRLAPVLIFLGCLGAQVIGGWASRIANWAPRISGTLLDPDGKAALDFGKIEEGWFKVAVPDGQDAGSGASSIVRVSAC